MDDAKRWLMIYGPEIAKLKGSTSRQRPDETKIITKISTPTTILHSHNTHAQSIPFHHSIARSYKFRTVESLRGKSKPSGNDIINMSKRAVNIYHNRGIRITQVNGDNEFEVLRNEMESTDVNIVAAGAHVGDVERSIRTIKNSTREQVHRLPYKRYPNEMVCG